MSSGCASSGLWNTTGLVRYMETVGEEGKNQQWPFLHCASWLSDLQLIHASAVRNNTKISLDPWASGTVEFFFFLSERWPSPQQIVHFWWSFFLCVRAGDDGEDKRVLVLSYPQYCRYRSIIARLRERPASLLTDQVVLALGGIATLTSSTQILYCRDTFEHPTLLENDSICDEFGKNPSLDDSWFETSLWSRVDGTNRCTYLL